MRPLCSNDEYNTVKVRIKTDLNKSLTVGYITNNCLLYKNKDNLITRQSKPGLFKWKALGIDNKLLLDPKYKYWVIAIPYCGKVYLTTKLYFASHSTSFNLFNGRNQTFLDIDLFGLAKALKWEKENMKKSLAKVDIFKVSRRPTLLLRWLSSLEEPN